MAQIYPYRKSEEARHEAEAGIREYRDQLTEEEYRQAFAPRYRPWDTQWGGRCPYEDTSPHPGYKDRSKPSLMDKLIPYILIVGFFGFFYFCAWLGYMLMGVAD